MLQSAKPDFLVAHADVGSLNTVFAGCAADPTCNAAYPNLEQTFFSLVADLNANPVTLHPTDPVTGQPFPVLVTGDRLLLGIEQALYDTALIPLILPAWISGRSEERPRPVYWGETGTGVVSDLAFR